MMSLAHGKATESAARLALGEQLIKVQRCTSTHTDRHTYTHTHSEILCLPVIGNEGIRREQCFNPLQNNRHGKLFLHMVVISQW